MKRVKMVAGCGILWVTLSAFISLAAAGNDYPLWHGPVLATIFCVTLGGFAGGFALILSAVLGRDQAREN